MFSPRALFCEKTTKEKSGEKTAQKKDIDCIFLVKDFPNEVGDEVFNKTFESLVTPQVDQLLVRARGRQSALKYTTPPSSSGFGWRLGDVRLDLKTDGRK